MDRSDNDGFQPYISEGLRLLRSNDPTAINTMFQRYYEAVKLEYGDRRPRNVAGEITTPIELLQHCASQTSANVDEASGSSSSSAQEPNTLASVAEMCSSLPPMITMEQAKSDPVIAIQSDSDGEANNNGECYVCKDNFFIVGNKLMECFGCHEVYHQNCHTPQITCDDPLIVWYCYNCQPSSSQKDDSLIKKTNKSEVKVHQSSQSKLVQSKISKSVIEMAGGSKPSSANSSPIHYSASPCTISTGTKMKESSCTLSANQPSDNGPKNIQMHSNILAAEKKIKKMRKNAAAKKTEKPKQNMNKKTY